MQRQSPKPPYLEVHDVLPIRMVPHEEDKLGFTVPVSRVYIAGNTSMMRASHSRTLPQLVKPPIFAWKSVSQNYVTVQAMYNIDDMRLECSIKDWHPHLANDCCRRQGAI